MDDLVILKETLRNKGLGSAITNVCLHVTPLCVMLFRLLAKLAEKKCKTWIKWKTKKKTKEHVRKAKAISPWFVISAAWNVFGSLGGGGKKKKTSVEAKAWTQNNCCRCWQRDCPSWRDPQLSPSVDPAPIIVTSWGDLAPLKNWQLFEECYFLQKTRPVWPVICARLLDGVNTSSASVASEPS